MTRIGSAGITPAAASATYALYTSVKASPYSATGNGSADDTAAIQAAIDAVASAGGGTVFFPPGTYVTGTLTLPSLVHLRGAGYEASALQLKAGTNGDLLKGTNFATLTGGNTTGGISQWSIADLTIDGNKANQSGVSHGLRVYGYGYRLVNLRIRNCLTDGIYTEWSTLQPTPGFDAMEAQVTDVKVHDCGHNGITWNGPHDSQFVNLLTFLNGNDGFHCASTVAVVNLHSWGNENIPVFVDTGAQGCTFTGCIAEGADYLGTDLNVPQVFIGDNDVTWEGGYVYSRGTTSGQVGFQIGDATHTGIAGTSITCKISGCTQAAFVFSQDSFGYYRSLIYGSGPCYTGTPDAKSLLELVNNGGGGSSAFYFPAAVKGPGSVLDDGSGVTTAGRFVAGVAAVNNVPPFVYAAAPSSPISWGGTLGFGLDSGYALAFNGGGSGMYFMNAGVKGNTVDDGSGNAITKGTQTIQGLLLPQQATTAGAPAYVKGGIYFDTTLNKLRVGGASGWETITSA